MFEATCQFHEISFNILLNNKTTIVSLLYRVIILSDKSPLPVSLFATLINHSPGQQISQSHSLNTRRVPNCSFGLAVPSHGLGPVFITFSQSEPQDCYKHRLLQYSCCTRSHIRSAALIHRYSSTSHIYIVFLSG